MAAWICGDGGEVRSVINPGSECPLGLNYKLMMFTKEGIQSPYRIQNAAANSTSILAWTTKRLIANSFDKKVSSLTNLQFTVHL